ncbi:hypothetical protein M8J77_008239 [Diaphorina citri]|nr:hypothetical protein M8J77_008239 [Diaphorina citri]
MSNDLETTKSLRFLATVLEKGGYVNFYHHKQKWKNSLQELYCHINYTLMAFFIVGRLLNTFTRAIHDWPEFLQNAVQAVHVILLFGSLYHYRRNHRQLDELITFIETSFSKADPDVLKACEKKVKYTFLVWLGLMIFYLVTAVLESHTPLSEHDKEMRRSIYHVKHPERILPAVIWIPGIDETESYNYEVILFIESYMSFSNVMMVIPTYSLAPTIITHLAGQFTILSQFVRKIGQRGEDDIPDVNVVANQNIVQVNMDAHVNKDDHLKKDAPGKKDSTIAIVVRELPENEGLVMPLQSTSQEGLPANVPSESRELQWEAYERWYIRQVILFHQKLLGFQEKMLSLIRNVLLIIVTCISITFSLSMFEIFVCHNLLIKVTVIKLAMMFISLLVHLYFVCYCSEQLNDSNLMLRDSLYNSLWYNCCPRARRDILMLLRRAQRPSYIVLYRGIIVISNIYISNFMKTAYSVVNFLKLFLK